MKRTYLRPAAAGRLALAVACAASLATARPLPAGAQASPSPMPMHLVKLPNGDYTVPLQELENSGTHGDVILHPDGTKTLVIVKVFGSPLRMHELHLHAARDCTELGAGATLPLQTTFGGQPSQTLVSLPIGELTAKDYVVDAHDATERNEFAEACAPLR
jgi:hypothetical protein